MMIRCMIAVFVLSLFPVAMAHAEPSKREAECAASYPARLADAKTAVAQYDTYMAEYKKALPAVEWFALHCRFLTELEIVVRKINDPNAYVCDPSARGKPSNLSSELILNYSTQATVASFQTMFGEDNLCEAMDVRGGRRALLFPGELSSVETIEFLCYQDERPSCVKARDTIAKLREKGKVPR